MLPTRFLVLLKTLVEALVMRLGISLVKLVIQLVIPQKKLDTLLKKEVLTKTTATKSKTFFRWTRFNHMSFLGFEKF